MINQVLIPKSQIGWDLEALENAVRDVRNRETDSDDE